jgi:diguanylate cyclase (GGDEF)-like protein
MPAVIDAQRALDVLLELTRQLTVERSLQRALQHVTAAAMQLLPGDHASIRVLDRTRTELLSGARAGAGVGKRPVKHTPGVGVAGWVVAHGEIARIGDTESDPRFIEKRDQGFEIRSMLAVPLWSAGEVVGVLAVTSGETDLYREEHESLACLLANCAVPPIEKARLRRLAVTDTQTMAYNQAYLIPGIQAEMEKLRDGPTRALSLLLLDIDEFKQINDRYGHAAGDQALRVFAATVRSSTRDGDVVVRRGGDEFVLIMPRTGRTNALAVAERIRSTVASTKIALPEGDGFSITVSIGIAIWDAKEGPEQLERRADQAMYEAKSLGRNRVEMAPGGRPSVPPSGGPPASQPPPSHPPSRPPSRE